MKLIIPVAGQGTRLRPHTLTTPKPLLRLVGKPIIGHVINSVKNIDIEEVILVISEEGYEIYEYVKNNFKFNVSYVVQKEAKGLGDAILCTREKAEGSEILILLGDTIFKGELNSAFKENFIAVYPVSEPSKYGIVVCKGNKIVALEEKPKKPKSNLAIVGIYFFKESAELFSALEELQKKNIKTKKEFQLTDAMSILLKKNFLIKKIEISKWLDCGGIESLIDAHRELLKEEISFQGKNINSHLIPPYYIEKNVEIEGSIIGPYVSIGENTKIKKCIITDSIVGEASILEQMNISSSIIGNYAKIKGKGLKLNFGDYSEAMF